MGQIKDPSPSDIEKFVAQRNEEFFTAYDKSLAFPEYLQLKTYIRKKYDAELQKHFVNVKIKNDLITISNTQPVDVGQR